MERSFVVLQLSPHDRGNPILRSEASPQRRRELTAVAAMKCASRQVTISVEFGHSRV